MSETVTATAEEQSALPELGENRFSNRELSWLNFNARVLALAEDRRQPLLERMKFLSIFASNLDEFYMVRVAGLKRRLEMGLAVRSVGGLSTRENLGLVNERARELMARHAECFSSDVRPALAEEGIRIICWGDLQAEQQVELTEYFHSKIFPVLTPLAVDPAHPFPYISGLSLNLAVLVREPDSELDKFARVKVPNNVPRFVVVTQTAEQADFLPIEELMAAHLSTLFPGMQIVEHHLFRVTRNTDFEVDEDRDEDLLQALERELLRRRFGPAVRLEVAEDIDEAVLSLLTSEIDVADGEVVRVPGLLDLTSLSQVYEVDRPALKEKPFVPATHPRFVEGETAKSVFATLRDGDVLVHHPYESFATSVQRFIEQAAADPNVLAIKQTLYRTSGDSPVVDALIDAAEAGNAGDGAGRDQGPVRRAGQHQVGPGAGAGRLPCGVRPGGPEDALQDRAGGPPGGRLAAPLCPYRHRQLPSQDRATVRGSGPVHRRRADLRGSDRSVQRAHRLLPADRVPHPAGRSAGSAARPARPHRARDPPCQGGQAGAHPDQVQPPGGRDADRRALPGVAGRRAGRTDGPDLLHHPGRRAGAEREHHGALDPGPVPRALPDLLLRQRLGTRSTGSARPT